MARIPLRQNGWEYDDETKRIVVTFVDTAGVDDPDPANFQSTISLEIELLPRIVDETVVEQPEQAEIEQIGIVVDQLVLDMLMSSLGAMPEL